MSDELRYKAIKQIVAKELKIDYSRISDTTTIYELGLDSLAFAEVIIALERYMGHSINTTEFADQIRYDTSFRDLVVLIENAIARRPVSLGEN